MKKQMMKSLWSSAPFWKTLSGINTRGRPESDIETGASLFRDLSSDLRSFSAKEGTTGGMFAELEDLGGCLGGRSEVWEEETGGKSEFREAGAGFGVKIFGQSGVGGGTGLFWGVGLGNGKEEELEALFSWIGEEFLGGRTLKFSRSR